MPLLGRAAESPLCSLGLACHTRSPRPSRPHRDPRAGRAGSPSLYLFAAAAAVTGPGCPAPPAAAAAAAAANFPQPWLPGSAPVPPRDGRPSEGAERRGDPCAPGRRREGGTHPCPPSHAPRPARLRGRRGQRAESGAGGSEGTGAGGAPEPQEPHGEGGTARPEPGSVPGLELRSPFKLAPSGLSDRR